VCWSGLFEPGVIGRGGTVVAAVPWRVPGPGDRRPVHGRIAGCAVSDRRRRAFRDSDPVARPRRLPRPVPGILADTVAAGVRATASLPLYRENGSLAGAIGFAWTRLVRFDTKLQSALHAVAELCTATIERAERDDADHQFIVDLSASLLGALPVIAGVETSARYLPASHTAAVGGDWYEGIVLGDQRLALVVGDVAGHGLAAPADMALLRGMITALLHSGVAVADVFGEVSDVLRQRAALLLASAALIVVDINAEKLADATAGHPPPWSNFRPGRSDGSTTRARR
jgi:hypothetical protein